MQSADPMLADLLQRWMGLSSLQQRTFQALIHEVENTSELVEVSTHNLSAEFQNLAVQAGKQSEHLQQVIEKASSTEIDGETISVRDLMNELLDDLSDMVQNVLAISKQGIHVSDSLQDLVSHIDAVDKSIDRIEGFTKQTNYLAVNAKLEAVKAGDAGKGFSVVAGEIANMSKNINSLSDDIRSQMEGVVDGLEKGRGLVGQLNAIDMSKNIMLKDRIQKVLQALLTQNDSLSETVKGSLGESSAISKTVGELITAMQFQDRTKQRMEHIVDILNVLAEAAGEMDEDTQKLHPNVNGVELDEKWLNHLLERFQLDEVKQRFISHVLMDGSFDEDEAETEQTVEHANASDDIELF